MKIKVEERGKRLLKQDEESYGFGLLFEKLWAKNIPFIGHNCNLDFLYIYHNLVGPLP